MNIKTTTLPLFALLLATTAAAQPAGQVPEAGKTYYVYNVKQQQYMADDGYGTLVLSAAGTPITLSVPEGSDGMFFMDCPKGRLSSSFLDPDVKTDGTGEYAHWRFSSVEGSDNVYTIACRFRETAAFSYVYWGQVAQRLVKSALVPGFDYEYGQWQFVSKDDYESQLVTLDELSDTYSVPAVTSPGGATVRLKRTLTLESWNTFCVPFDIDAEQLRAAFGSDVKVAEYTGCDETTLKFTSCDEVRGGVPYLIRPTKDRTDGGYYEFTGVKSFVAEPAGVAHAPVTYMPSFVYTTAPQGAYVIRKNMVYLLQSQMAMKGFRGYFVEDGAEGKLNEWTLDGMTTGVALPGTDTPDTSDTPTYDTAGRRVSGNPAKGVYIKNGKKTIIK